VEIAHYFFITICAASDSGEMEVNMKIMDESFQCKAIEGIDFKDDFNAAIFSLKDLPVLFEVVLEYSAVDEFFLTDKIDAKFFHRSNSEGKGRIIFPAFNLEWTTNLVFSLQDKIKVVKPIELKKAIKIKIKKINELYKDDI
jgi:predicted DNA-binding transcriptional regulator YafY